MHIFIAKIKMSEGQYDTFHLEIYVQKKIFVFIYDSDL